MPPGATDNHVNPMTGELMNPTSGLVAGLLFVLAAQVSAEVYRNVDAYGNVTFSDEPSEGAEAIELKPVTTTTLPKPEGQPVGQSASGTISVNNVYRGTHEARVYIVDGKGVQIKTGPSITFTVHRPSILN